jgi:hypothetical protein
MIENWRLHSFLSKEQRSYFDQMKELGFSIEVKNVPGVENIIGERKGYRWNFDGRFGEWVFGMEALADSVILDLINPQIELEKFGAIINARVNLMIHKIADCKIEENKNGDWFVRWKTFKLIFKKVGNKYFATETTKSSHLTWCIPPNQKIASKQKDVNGIRGYTSKNEALLSAKQIFRTFKILIRR